MANRGDQQVSGAVKSAAELRNGAVNARIHFRTNESMLDSSDRQALKQLCLAVKAGPTANGGTPILAPVGHADTRGTNAHNLRLSRLRALAVARVIKDAVPESIVFLGGYGEKLAELKNLPKTRAARADQRRVDVFYFQIIGYDKPTKITAPTVKEIANDAARIVRERASGHRNEAARLQCYLKKLQQPATQKNDRYLRFPDLMVGQDIAYEGGRISYSKLDRALRMLDRRARSARKFLRAEVDTMKTDDDKFRRLLELDRDIFQSYSKSTAKLIGANFGGERMMPYWVAIKNKLVGWVNDPDTLYNCIEFRKLLG